MLRAKPNTVAKIALIFMSVSFLYWGNALAQTHDIAFLPNQGQWDDFIQYRADLSDGVFWMEEAGWTAWVAGEGYNELWSHDEATQAPEELKSHAWKVDFVDANTASIKTGANELGYHVNYYVGNDPSTWAEGILPVSRVNYSEVWPGINMRMDGTARGSKRLKYDWIIKPEGDPSDIKLKHTGTDVSIQSDGTLVHDLGSTGHIIEGSPYAFQLIDTKLVEVECAYKAQTKRDGSTVVRFEVDDYDQDYDLIIDPD
ncbi:MAG: hypothetical protein CMB32_01515, partial [Euryarchaeota archaeon]|nr:hypothetical protein [Euryarchaeota archaeon]